jgi:hypothetical protein
MIQTSDFQFMKRGPQPIKLSLEDVVFCNFTSITNPKDKKPISISTQKDHTQLEKSRPKVPYLDSLI